MAPERSTGSARLGRHWPWALLTLLLITSTLAADPSASSKSADAPTSLPLATFEFPPYHFHQQGRIRGASVDVVELIFRRLGYQPQIHFMPWRRAQLEAAQGTYAAVFTFTESAQRRQRFHYSEPLSLITDIFYKRRGETINWQQLSDLKALRIGISAGYNYVPEFMTAMAQGELVVEVIAAEAPELQQMKLLQLGRIDLSLCIFSRCEHLRQQRPELFAGIDYIPTPVGAPRSFYVGFSKAWPRSEQLRDQFNQQLGRLKADGTLTRILDSYGISPALTP